MIMNRNREIEGFTSLSIVCLFRLSAQICFLTVSSLTIILCIVVVKFLVGKLQNLLNHLNWVGGFVVDE